MFRRQQFNLLLFPLALQVFFVPAFQAVVDADGGASEISGHGWNHETLGWCFSVSSSINKGIPDLFEAKTLKVFGVGGSEFVHLESA